MKNKRIMIKKCIDTFLFNCLTHHYLLKTASPHVTTQMENFLDNKDKLSSKFHPALKKFEDTTRLHLCIMFRNTTGLMWNQGWSTRI